MGMSPKILGPAARALYNRQIPNPQGIAARTRKGQSDSKHRAVEFLNICEKAALPKPELEYRFHPERMWRFDFAWPKYKLALEVDGGVFLPGAGRHNSGAGFSGDCEKLNSAAVIGWRILRVFPKDLLKIETIEMVRRAMRGAWHR